MNDWRKDTLDDYRSKGFAERSGYGDRPALLIVDFIYGFTDPATALGGDFTAELDATARLLQACRGGDLPVVYTTIAFQPHFRDAGMFIKKVPALSLLTRGSHWVEVDERIRPVAGEHVVEKKFASAFFDTGLDRYLRDAQVDTVVMAGCTTSGCIRASAIDSMQYGFHTVVVREAVGDRAAGPHDANLFDIDAKYGDVVPLAEALDYLSVSSASGLAVHADQDFRRWWSDGRAKLP